MALTLGPNCIVYCQLNKQHLSRGVLLAVKVMTKEEHRRWLTVEKKQKHSHFCYPSGQKHMNTTQSYFSANNAGLYRNRSLETFLQLKLKEMMALLHALNILNVFLAGSTNNLHLHAVSWFVFFFFFCMQNESLQGVFTAE